MEACWIASDCPVSQGRRPQGVAGLRRGAADEEKRGKMMQDGCRQRRNQTLITFTPTAVFAGVAAAFKD